MLPDEFHSRLQVLYDNYNGVIKPLIAEIEMLEKTQPMLLFNEIRAFNDHIARCFFTDVSDEFILKNIESAEGHIYRLIFDCSKWINTIYHLKYNKFLQRYKNVDVRVIDNGEFLSKLRKYKYKADQSFKQASLNQTINKDDSIEKFKDAIDNYRKIDSLLAKKSPDLWWAKSKYRFKSILKVVIILFLTLFLGIIGNIICHIIGYNQIDNLIVEFLDLFSNFFLSIKIFYYWLV